MSIGSESIRVENDWIVEGLSGNQKVRQITDGGRGGCNGTV